MAKVRLDLMVDERVKKMLRDVAATEGISMSQLVEVMLTEHLSGDAAAADPMNAVADLLWIQRLQDQYRRAMGLGRIHSFRSWSERVGQRRPSEDEPPTILYVGKGEEGFIEGDIVIDWYLDGSRKEILSTYDEVLRTVCVRMEWTDAPDGTFVPYGFLVWPKRGGSRIDEPLFEWKCPVSWPGSAVGPGYGVSIEYQDREGGNKRVDDTRVDEARVTSMTISTIELSG